MQIFRHRLWRWILGTILLGIFSFWVQDEVGWGQIVSSWSSLDPLETGLAVLLLGGSYLARAGRIRAAFPTITWGPTLQVVLVHTASNNFLPVRSGELAFPFMMKSRFQLPVRLTVPRLLWFRCLDAAALGALALLVFCAALLEGPARYGGGLAVLVGIWLVVQGVGRFARRLDARWAGTASRGRSKWHSLLQGVPAVHSERRGVEAWTLATWVLKLTAFVILMRNLGHLGWKTSLLGAVGGELSSVLPIHGLAGAGTYEAGILAILTPMQVALDRALPVAVTLHLFILASSLLGLLLALLPLRWWKSKGDLS